MKTHIFNIEDINFNSKKDFHFKKNRTCFDEINDYILEILNKNGHCRMRDIISFLKWEYGVIIERNQISNLIYKLKSKGKIKSIKEGNGNNRFKYYIDNEDAEEGKP